MKDIFFDSNRVKIYLKVGINMYEPESAIGKSYLPRLINGIEGAPLIIVVDNKISYRRIMEKGIDTGVDDIVYFFDRANLFMTKELEKMLYEACTDSIILIDDKHCRFFHEKLPIYMLETKLTEDKLEVTTYC